MRHFEDTNETQMTMEGSDSSSKDRYLFYTRGRFIWNTAKGGKMYENKNDFLFIDEKSN